MSTDKPTTWNGYEISQDWDRLAELLESGHRICAILWQDEEFVACEYCEEMGIYRLHEWSVASDLEIREIVENAFIGWIVPHDEVERMKREVVNENQ